MTSIIKILKKEGPLLSSELKKRLNDEGSNDEAIRKRFSRLKSPILRIKGFFKDRQVLFYLEDHFKNQKGVYYEGVINAFKLAAKRHYAIVKAIEYHNGLIGEDEIASYSFSPIKPLRGHKLVGNVIEDLLKQGILFKEGSQYLLNPYIFSNPNSRRYKALELSKRFLVGQFEHWAKNIGFVSFNSGRRRGEFWKFQWAFSAPSYVNSIARRSVGKTEPGFVVADILVGKKATLETVGFFIRKIEVLNANKNVSNFIPFLIVESVEKDALQALKKKGVVVGFVKTMFGPEYEELLKELIETVTNAGAILKSNPEAYLTLLKNLEKLVEGKTFNLRGDLFELAVGYYFSSSAQFIEIGKKVPTETKKIEIDVFAVYQGKVVLVECKGKKSPLKKEYVEKWLGERIPAFRKWILEQDQFKDKSLVFEVWSTGGFEEDAAKLLSDRAQSVKKYSINRLNFEEILQRAEDEKLTKFKEILTEYYLKTES